MTNRLIWLAMLVVGGLTAATSLAAQTPDLYYKFNDGSGSTAVNDGTQGANGTFTSTPTWVSPGQLGSHAVNFAPGNQMSTGYNPSTRLTGSFTMETWIRTSHAELSEWLGSGNLAQGSLFYWYQQTSGEFSVFFDDATASAPVRYDSSVAINDGNWHHIAVVYDSAVPDFRFYVDGVEDTGASLGAGTLPISVGATSLILGDNSLASAIPSTDWVGDLDDFRIWNVARTSTEIANNYGIELGQTGPEINVIDPNGDQVPDGGTHVIDPVSPNGSGTFSWTIQSLNPSADLNLGTITVAAVSGCAVSITADPSNSAVTGGSSATLTIQVTGDPDPGTLQFTISIPSDDADENPYDITVNGSRGLEGNFTIDTGGTPDYSDIGAAFDDLEELGVSGPVTFTVSDSSGTGYSSNASYELGSDNGIVDDAEVRGTSATNTILFEAATGTAPEISGNFPINLFGVSNFGIVTIAFTNVSHLTFRGFDISGTTDTNVLVYQTAALPGGSVSIERCRVHSNISGAGVTAFGNGKALSDFTFENNIMWACGPTGGVFTTMLTIPQNGMLALFNADASCSIEHNTILLTEFGFPTADACCMSITGGLSDLGGFNYNIVQTVASNTKLVDIPSGLEPAAADYNFYYFPAGTATFSPQQVSLTLWQGANATLDQNSSDQDPELASTTAGSEDLHISGTSPCIDAATGSTATIDFEGDPRTGTNDIGADEQTGGGGPSTPSVSIAATDSSAAENPADTETGEYTITLSPAPAATLVVDFTMTGTASTTPGTDYDLSTTTAGVTLNFTGPDGTISVPAGTSTVVILLTPVDDALVESAESAIMNISNGTGYTVSTTQSSATVTILDNDGTGTPVVTVTASGTPSESGPTPGSFILNANPVPSTPITVAFTLSGTATDGVDYNVSPTGSVTIDASGTATVTLTPIDDSIQEGVETATLTISTGTGYTVGTPGSATLNIADNDTGGGTGSVGGGGGGSGGGGCVAVSSSAPWVFVLGLLGLFALAVRGRTRTE